MTLHEYIDLTRCPACHNENESDSVLGTLGRLTWVRCRYCGMQYNIKAELGQAAELVYPIS